MSPRDVTFVRRAKPIGRRVRLHWIGVAVLLLMVAPGRMHAQWESPGRPARQSTPAGKLRHGLDLPAVDMRLRAIDAFARVRDPERLAVLLDIVDEQRDRIRRIERKTATLAELASKKRKRGVKEAQVSLQAERKKLRGALRVLGTVMRTAGVMHGALDTAVPAETTKAFRTMVVRARKSGRIAERLAAVTAFTAASLPHSFETITAWYDTKVEVIAKRYRALRGDDGTIPPASKLVTPTEASELRGLRAALGRVFARLDAAMRAPAIERLREGMERAKGLEIRRHYLAAFGHLHGPEARVVLDHAMAAADAETRMVVVSALAVQGDAAGVLSILKVLDDASWRVQATAIGALARIGGVGAVDGLVRKVARSEGRILDDCEAALRRLTGKTFHGNGFLWRKWWREHRRSYTGRPKPTRSATALAQRKAAFRGRESGFGFYGIQSRSKRVVFILDLSGSMKAPLRPGRGTTTQRPGARRAPAGARRIDQARSELASAITALPEDATFNVIVYGADVEAWRGRQTKATAPNKKRALAWAREAEPKGGTNLYGGLQKAFALAGRGDGSSSDVVADTFFLLSDGEPTMGEIIDPNGILHAVTELNRYRRIRINTVLLGSKGNTLMPRLAAQTGGDFVHFGRG